MAIVEKVDGSPTAVFARPSVNGAAFVIKKVRLFATRINQIVTRECARIICQNAEFFGLECWRFSLLCRAALRSDFFCGILCGFGVSRSCGNRPDCQSDRGDGRRLRPRGPRNSRPHVEDSSRACPGSPRYRGPESGPRTMLPEES